MADNPADDRGGRPVHLRVDKLEQQVATLAESVSRLSAIVARIASGQEAPAVTVPTADPDTAVASEDLVAWVQWFVRWYAIDDIPECWAEHGALVEELSALHVGWQSTIGQGQPGLVAAQWHDYAGRALDRIRTRWRTCPDNHRPHVPPAWTDTDPAAATRPDG